MSRSRTLLLALAAVLLTLGVWWVASLGERAPPSAPSAATLEVPLGADPGAIETELSAEEPGASTQVAPQETTGRTRVLFDEEEEAELSGQVVDSQGRPIPGAKIGAVRSGAIEFELLADPGLEAAQRPVAQTMSGADGRFELRLALGRAHRLQVTAETFAPTVASNVYAGDSVTIVVRRGSSVSGRVTRREDGVPIAGARVLIDRLDVPVPIWEGTTDEDGRYVAQGVDPGENGLQVIPIEECRERITFELNEGDAIVRDVQVSFGLIVRGVVKSRETGLPLAGAQVGSELHLGKVASTDAAGRYELAGVAESPVVNVSARAEGYGAHDLALQPGGDRILTANFDLTRGRVASGRVVLRDGNPVPGAYVAALGRSIDRGGLHTDHVSARTGNDGRFRLAGLRGDLPHALLVHREWFAPTIVQGIDARSDDEIELGDLVLCPGASLSGRVLSLDGKPIQEAWVDLATSDPAYADPALGLRRRNLRTGSAGRFRFLGLPAGPHVLQVFVSGLANSEKVEIDLAEGESRRNLEVVVGSGQMIRGRVLDPEGLGLEAADLVLRKAGGPVIANTTSGHDGRFQFAGLGQGLYDLTAAFADLHGPSTDRYELAEVTLPGIRAGPSEVEVAFRRLAEITGRVVAPDGNGIPFALVVAIDRGGLRRDGRIADGEGRFHLRVASDATFELRAWRTKSNPETGRGRWADETSLPEAVQSEVRAGEREITLVMAP